MSQAIKELNEAIHGYLEFYSNVHRGSGFASQKSTESYEAARADVLDFLELSSQKYVAIFSSPRRARNLMTLLPNGSYELVESQMLGLNLAVCALAIKKQALPKGRPQETGGGTAKLTSQEWIIWAREPDKFEAGTPAIINILAFVKALQLTKQYGKNAFQSKSEQRTPAQIDPDWMNLKGADLLEKLRSSLIGMDLVSKGKSEEHPYIHLDNAASTRTFEPIWSVFRDKLLQSNENQTETVSLAKARLFKFLGANSDNYEIFFTSNTTEAINLVAQNLTDKHEKAPSFQVVNSLLEHSSNDLPWRHLPKGQLHRLGVSKEGFIDLKELETVLSASKQKDGQNTTKLVSVSGASNVLGTCTPIQEISQITKAHSVPLLIDAAQMVAHRKIDVEKMGMDALVLSGHKIYAPFGTGVLLAKKGFLNLDKSDAEKLQLDAKQNAAGIAALGMAVQLLHQIGMDYIQEKEEKLTKLILEGLSTKDEYMLYGISDPDSSQMTNRVGVIAFAHKKIMADKVAKKLTQKAGIGLRAGCHCAHPIVKHVLGISLGLEKFQRILQNVFPKISFPGVARVSLGLENTEQDVQALLSALPIQK